MTPREYFTDYLYKRGMFEDEAAECMAFAEKHELMEPMDGRWHKSAEGYSVQTIAALSVSMDSIAIEWIDTVRAPRNNGRSPWYRQMFVAEKPSVEDKKEETK